MVLKTLNVEYEINGKIGKWSGNDNDVVTFTESGIDNSLYFKIDMENEKSENSGLIFCQRGHYELQTFSGKKIEKDVTIPELFEITGSWTVQFPIKGTIKEIIFDKLISWSDSPDEAVKYFSGTAIYQKKFNVPKDFPIQRQRVFLDLGRVNEIAVVKVNGKEQGVLWTLSKTVDITDVLKPDAENVLEIQATNLWCNRLIGDAHLPQDKERQPNGTLSAWPEWLQKGQPDPYGRETFCMWNLWKKEDALQPSSLLGPVQIIIADD